MALIAFYLLVSLIFANAAAISIALIPRIYDQRFRLLLLLSLALAVSSFIAYFSVNWPLLMAGFGVYCIGLFLDVSVFSNKSQKLRIPFMILYALGALASFLAFFTDIKILFLLTYTSYWCTSFALNKGLFNGINWTSKRS